MYLYYYNSVAVFIQASANHGLPVCLSLILKLLFGLEFGTEVQIRKLILNQKPVQYKSGAEVFDFGNVRRDQMNILAVTYST